MADRAQRHAELIKKNAIQNDQLIHQQAHQKNMHKQAEKMASIRAVYDQLDHFNQIDNKR
jgi:hypothetical protein